MSVTVVRAAAKVIVEPGTAILSNGQTEQFRAAVIDQFGAPLATQPPIGWGIVPGGVGTVNPSTGLYTAPATGAGTANVVAASGAVYGFAEVVVNQTIIPPPPTSQYHINFTADPALTPPAYVSDTGQALGPQANGLYYGWNKINTANAAERNNPAAPDELHDSYVAMQGRSDPNASWTIAIQNGVYYVRLIAGDPNSNNSVYRMNINGALALKGTPKGSQHWVESTVRVVVTNNRITVSNARGARNNKLDAIDIVSAPPVATPASHKPAGPRAIRARR